MAYAGTITFYRYYPSTINSNIVLASSRISERHAAVSLEGLEWRRLHSHSRNTLFITRRGYRTKRMKRMSFGREPFKQVYPQHTDPTTPRNCNDASRERCTSVPHCAPRAGAVQVSGGRERRWVRAAYALTVPIARHRGLLATLSLQLHVPGTGEVYSDI